MPALTENRNRSLAICHPLKTHIGKERQKNKQEEEDDDDEDDDDDDEDDIKQLKLERENKQKQDILDQTKEQNSCQLDQLELKLEMLKQKKHELFCQLKKVIYEDEIKRLRAVVKGTSETVNPGRHNYPAAMHGNGAQAQMFMQGQMSNEANMQKTIPQQPMLNSSVNHQQTPSPPANMNQCYPHSIPQNMNYMPRQMSNEANMQKTIPQQPMLNTSVNHQQIPSPPANMKQCYPHSKPQNMNYMPTLSSSAEPGQPYSTPQTTSDCVAYTSHLCPPGQSAFPNFSGHYTQQQKQIAEPLQSQLHSGHHVQQQDLTRNLHQSLEHSHKPPNFAYQEKLLWCRTVTN